MAAASSRADAMITAPPSSSPGSPVPPGDVSRPSMRRRRRDATRKCGEPRRTSERAGIKPSARTSLRAGRRGRVVPMWSRARPCAACAQVSGRFLDERPVPRHRGETSVSAGHRLGGEPACTPETGARVTLTSDFPEETGPDLLKHLPVVTRLSLWLPDLPLPMDSQPQVGPTRQTPIPSRQRTRSL